MTCQLGVNEGNEKVLDQSCLGIKAPAIFFRAVFREEASCHPGDLDSLPVEQ